MGSLLQAGCLNIRDGIIDTRTVEGRRELDGLERAVDPETGAGGDGVDAYLVAYCLPSRSRSEAVDLRMVGVVLEEGVAELESGGEGPAEQPERPEH